MTAAEYAAKVAKGERPPRTLERADVRATLAVLAEAERKLQSMVTIVGYDTPAGEVHRQVKAERERLGALAESCAPGPRELFRAAHPPALDQLDNIYDCGTCYPQIIAATRERRFGQSVKYEDLGLPSRAEHLEMWRHD